MFKGVDIQIGDTLLITVFSMALVFVTLLAISFLIDALKTISAGNNRNQKKQGAIEKPVANKEQPKTSNIVEIEEDEELIAVITAAIAASLSREARSIVVRSIRRLPQESSGWIRASRQEQVFNKL